MIGDAALWLPVRLWCYCAEHQQNGDLSSYDPGELAGLLGYTGDAESMLTALIESGFLDTNPLRVHDWLEHNQFHLANKQRASNAAKARWAKATANPPHTLPKPEEKEEKRLEEKRGEERRIAPSNASSMLQQSAPQSGVVGEVDLSSRTDGVGSVYPIVSGLTRSLPSAIAKPTIQELRNHYGMEFDGAVKHAEGYLQAMEKSNWRDKDGNPIQDWRVHSKSWLSGVVRNQRGVARR